MVYLAQKPGKYFTPCLDHGALRKAQAYEHQPDGLALVREVRRHLNLEIASNSPGSVRVRGGGQGRG